MPAVRIKFVMMSRPTSEYRGIINGRATPGFSIFMWLPFWPARACNRAVHTRRLIYPTVGDLGGTCSSRLFLKSKRNGHGKTKSPGRNQFWLAFHAYEPEFAQSQIQCAALKAKWRSIKVQVVDAPEEPGKLSVRTRYGYYADKEKK